MNLDHLKISTRLTLGFAVMALLMGLLGALSVVKISHVNDEFRDVMDDRYAKIVIVNDIKVVNNEVAQALRNLFVMTDTQDIQAQFAVLDASGPRTNANVDKLKATITAPAGKAALDKLMAARAEYRAPREKLITLLRAGQLDEARPVLLAEVRPRQAAYMAAVDELIRFQEGLMKASAEEVSASVASTKLTVAAMLLVSFGLAALIAWRIIRSTTRPLAEAVRVTRAVADGDLAVEFDTAGKSETAVLLQALHDMKTRLAGIVAGVRQNADGVATASAEIAQGNSDLSGRTEQQASALEETAASMEQLSATVKQNADNARQGNQLAMSASGVAAEGGEVVSQVVETMKGINDSSKKIGDIIGVIDGIAFQTNILALNAAVEAARAGEQGRGFAVVAGEVRTLAQRSAEAAKEIKGLINASVERVEQGSALVDRAGATMAEVVASIRRVTDIMGEISAASTEQSAGVGQVGEAITQMDQAVQQNAALVEQSAAAAESLRHQADAMVGAVAVFRLGHDMGRSAAVAPTPARPVSFTPAKPAANATVAERRSPQRAKNVARLPAAKAATTAPSPAPAAHPAPAAAEPVRTGTDDWESF